MDVVITNEYGEEEQVSIRYTDELSRDLTEAREKIGNYAGWGCQHSITEIRTKIASNGRPMVAHQCLDCGNIVGSFLKKENWPENRPTWDNDIHDQKYAEWTKRRKNAEEEVYIKHIKTQKEDKEKYGQYLLSYEWREKRAKVLERDKYVCQGCLTNRATQVHHKTYDHIYDEFLFELESVCDECHERIYYGK